MLKIYGSNEEKEETIVETPTIENKPIEVVNDKEYTPDSKTLLELIAGLVEWVKKLFSK